MAKKRLLFEFVFIIFICIILVCNSIYSIFSILSPRLSWIYIFFLILMILALKEIILLKKEIFHLVLFFFLGLFVLIQNGSGLGNLILIGFQIAMIVLLSRVIITEKFFDRLNIIILIAWFFVAVTSMSFSYIYIQSIISGGEVRGFNPNTVALILGALYWLIISRLPQLKLGKYIKRMCGGAFTIITFVLIVRCRSRASMISLIAVLLLNIVFGKKIKKSKKMACFIFIAIIAVGLIIPFIYTEMWRNPKLANLSIFGKRLFTGRQYIWLNLFEYFKNNPVAYIIGCGYNETFYSKGIFNLHNSYLQLIATFGIPIFCIYIGYLFGSIKRAYKSTIISNRKKDFLMLGYFLLIVGFFETNLTYLLMIILPVLSFGILGSLESR